MKPINTTRRQWLHIAAMVASAAVPWYAHAADLPGDYFAGKTLKIIVPYPAGGTSDPVYVHDWSASPGMGGAARPA